MITSRVVDPITHRITEMVVRECVSLKPLWAVPRVPKLLEGPEVLQILSEKLRRVRETSGIVGGGGQTREGPGCKYKFIITK